jgi:hypothetical protein
VLALRDDEERAPGRLAVAARVREVVLFRLVAARAPGARDVRPPLLLAEVARERVAPAARDGRPDVVREPVVVRARPAARVVRRVPDSERVRPAVEPRERVPVVVRREGAVLGRAGVREAVRRRPPCCASCINCIFRSYISSPSSLRICMPCSAAMGNISCSSSCM